MKSVDTNILVYAVNGGCEEHERARSVYEEMLASPVEWIVSDQVLFEFYRALRNARILERPLNHAAALRQIRFLREETGVLHCAYEARFWDGVMGEMEGGNVRSAHVFDRVLAVTLLRNGVETFYTRNTRDFAEFSFRELINPVDG